MKKLICIAILLLNIMGIMAVANDPNDINPIAKRAFDKIFPQAQYPTWRAVSNENIYFVRFVNNSQPYIAYLDGEGVLLATLRSVTRDQLPFPSQRTLNDRYSDFEVRDIVEMMVHQTLSYLVTVSNEKSRIQLRVYGNGETHEIKKEKVKN